MTLNALVLAVVAAAALLIVVVPGRTRLREPAADLRVHTVDDDMGRRPATLSLSAGRVRLIAGSGEPQELLGPVTVDDSTAPSRRARRSSARVRLRTHGGRQLAVEVSPLAARATARLLSGRDVHGLPPWRPGRTGRGAWAAALLLLAVGWAAFLLVLGLDGYAAEATVLRSDGGWTCEVAWQDTFGVRQHDDSDCFGEPVGSTLEITVPWGDFRGAVTTRPTLALVAGVGAAPLLLAGGFLLRSATRRRRNEASLIRFAGFGPTPPTAGRPPACSAPATAAALTRALRLAWLTVGAAAVALVAVVVLAMISSRADAGLRSSGVTTDGTVVDVTYGGRYRDDSADVRFRAGGRPLVERTDIAGYADDYERGQRVRVRYDPMDPQVFTVDDLPYTPPWTSLPTIVSWGALIGGAFVALMLFWTRRATARLVATGVWEPIRVRVWRSDKRCWFSTPDGSSWRGYSGGWPEFDEAPEDGDPYEFPGQDAWWVRDGAVAVFSPDRGRPLVLARLR